MTSVEQYHKAYVLMFAIALVSFSGCKQAPQKTASTPASSRSPSTAATPIQSGPSEPITATQQPASPETPPLTSSTPQMTQKASPVAPPQQPAVVVSSPIVVPSGTAFSIRLTEGLSSKSANAGDSFSGTISRAVVVNGKSAIPIRSNIAGTVISAKSAGKFKGAAALAITSRSITVHGHSYQVETSTYSQQTTGKGKRTATMIGGGAGGGALIGGLAGGGKGAAIGALAGGGAGTAGAALTGNNRDIALAPETLVNFTLKKSLSLEP